MSGRGTLLSRSLGQETRLLPRRARRGRQSPTPTPTPHPTKTQQPGPSRSPAARQLPPTHRPLPGTAPLRPARARAPSTGRGRTQSGGCGRAAVRDGGEEVWAGEEMQSCAGKARKPPGRQTTTAAPPLRLDSQKPAEGCSTSPRQPPPPPPPTNTHLFLAHSGLKWIVRQILPPRYILAVLPSSSGSSISGATGPVAIRLGSVRFDSELGAAVC
jgi:hypothetical protein